MIKTIVLLFKNPSTKSTSISVNEQQNHTEHEFSHRLFSD